MISTWKTLAFLVVISSFVQFITFAEVPAPEIPRKTKITASDAIPATTENNGAQQTPVNPCLDRYIIRPIRWFIDGPLKTFWNSMINAKNTLATFYGISPSKTEKTV